jgi:DNA-binding transcriptional regulator YiaG
MDQGNSEMTPTPTQLREIREKAPLTQRAAAERLGVSLKTIQSWEGGWRQIPEPMWKLFQILIGSVK